jgi:TonB family protein
MLKSALSDFGLGEEKKRPPEKPKTITPPSVPPPPNRPAKRLEPVPRTPPPPAPAETPVEPTPPKPEKGIVFGPPPGFGAAAKTVDDTNGDPGRRPALFETRKAEPKPVPVTPPKPVPSARTESPVPKPRPAREHENKPSFVPQPARLQHDRDTISPAILEDLDKPEKKKGLPLLAIVGPSVVVLGVAGFLFLRPKTKSSESPVQAGVKPISAPVKSGSNPTQSPAEFTAEVERKAAALTKELREKAKANVAEPPPNPIVGDPVLDVPVKPTTESLELAGAPVRRNGEERAAGNPAAKPAPKTAENPPAKTESGGVSAAGTSTAESAPPPPAAKTVNEGDLWPLEEVDVPPQVLRRINPVYPSLAQMLKIEGSITVNALVSETGSVIDTAILKGMKDDRGLEKAAAEAVRKWRFEPALKNGIRVKVWRPVVIVFELEK